MPKQFNIDEIVQTEAVEGLVDRTVGDSIFYVSLKDGTSLGFHPNDVIVKSRKGLKRFRGESFRELGLFNGAKVKVFGLKDPAKPDYVLVESEHAPRFLSWLRPGT